MPFSFFDEANVSHSGMVPQSAVLVELCHFEGRDH